MDTKNSQFVGIVALVRIYSLFFASISPSFLHVSVLTLVLLYYSRVNDMRSVSATMSVDCSITQVG